jgi:hypothetical protein
MNPYFMKSLPTLFHLSTLSFQTNNALSWIHTNLTWSTLNTNNKFELKEQEPMVTGLALKQYLHVHQINKCDILLIS